MINEILNAMFDVCIENKNNLSADCINNELFMKCCLIVSKVNIETDAHALLVLNAMCALNAYVKQSFIGHITFPNDKMKYWFKNVGYARLIEYMNKNHDKSELYAYFNPKEKFGDNVIFFEIGDIQYSFHGIDSNLIKYIPSNKFRRTVFNEIQNKKCINKLFDLVWESNLFSDSKDYSNQSLKEYIQNRAKYLCSNFKNISINKLKKEFDWQSNFIDYGKKFYTAITYINKFEPTNWEFFGPSGEAWQQLIFELYIKHINVQIKDNKLSGKCFLFNEEWVKQNPKSTANLIKLIYEHGGIYSFSTDKVNVFVNCELTNDWDQICVSKNLDFFKKQSNNDKAEIISFDNLFNQLNIDLKLLIKMKYPSDEWFKNVSDNNINYYKQKASEIKKEYEEYRKIKIKERKEKLLLNSWLEVKPDEDSPFARLEKKLYGNK